MQLEKVASPLISVLLLHKSKPVFTVQRRCPSASGKTCSLKLLAFIKRNSPLNNQCY
jgi:hypothetical protein